jgi:hypothetical protein
MAWDYHAVQVEIDRAVEKYAAALAREHVTVDVSSVTAVMRLDGALLDLAIDSRALRRLGSDELGGLIAETIRAAEHEAAGRREALAETVTILGEPVFALVREMTNDPQGVARRLAAEATMRL